MQRLYAKAREVYPDWDPYISFQQVIGLMEVTKFIDTLNEMYPDTEWIPIDDFGIDEYADPTFRSKLKTVSLGFDFKPKQRARIFSMTFGSFFFKPNEVMPDTGSYFLPAIVPAQSFKPTRSIIQSFDVDKLVDLKHSTPLVPKGKMAANIHLEKEAWKNLVKEKYFKDNEKMVDQMLDSIYDLDAHPPRPTAELLGRIMIRIHEDDFDTFFGSYVGTHYTSNEEKGAAYIERMKQEKEQTT